MLEHVQILDDKLVKAVDGGDSADVLEGEEQRGDDELPVHADQRAEGRVSQTDYLLDAEQMWTGLVTQLGFRLLPTDDWEDSDQLPADAGLLLVLHRLQAQPSETGKTWKFLVMKSCVCLVLAQHSVPDLSSDRLEVKTMEGKTPG